MAASVVSAKHLSLTFSTSDGPVNALVDLALGHGRNLSPGTIGAETTATIAALLASARHGGRPEAILAATGERAAS